MPNAGRPARRQRTASYFQSLCPGRGQVPIRRQTPSWTVAQSAPPANEGSSPCDFGHLRERVGMHPLRQQLQTRCANAMLTAQKTAPRDDNILVASDPNIHCGFMDYLKAGWFSVSTGHGQFHLCIGGLCGQREKKRGSDFLSPREGAAPL